MDFMLKFFILLVVRQSGHHAANSSERKLDSLKMDVSEGELPFMASVYRRALYYPPFRADHLISEDSVQKPDLYRKYFIQLGVGSILSPLFVLTTDGCLGWQDGKETSNVMRFLHVAAGVDHQLLNIWDRKTNYRPVVKLYYHRNRTRKLDKKGELYWVNDLVILQLKSPLTFDSQNKIDRVCLAPSDPVQSDIIITAGYAYNNRPTEKGIFSINKLRDVVDGAYFDPRNRKPLKCETRLADPDDCQIVKYKIIHTTCRKGAPRDPCFLDLGAPLLIVRNGEVWCQFAISSYEFHHNKDYICEAESPVRFTLIRPYLNWIKSIVTDLNTSTTETNSWPKFTKSPVTQTLEDIPVFEIFIVLAILMTSFAIFVIGYYALKRRRKVF